ncbi:MlaA family lipoprotein [Chitinilyticum litopenaei]|uniref:MlaA family lipoprotein n=1 Tax=Chitinilyticum litopenaei TaxID=1121276 RepID=UPI000409D6E6|nr:VacJ family lipoprotein [Chitinilyticum litopenaei]
MRLIAPLLLTTLLAACASPGNNYDPLEPVNRPIYGFNRAVDKALLRPVATGWRDYMPPPIQTGVSNFFGNIDDLFAIPASALQGKWQSTATGTGRVLMNTTFGIAGLFDIASRVPLAKQDEDFGQALGYWGVGSGPYLMLPFYGPLTLRDSVDPLSRLAWGPIDYIEPLAGQIGYYSVGLVNLRAELLPLDAALDEALDPYAFMRDGYLQRRWFKVHDGNPPHPLPMGDPDDDGDADKAAGANDPASGAATGATQ